MDIERETPLSCFFLVDVLCLYRKSDTSRPIERCFRCPHHLRFMREVEEEEDKFFDECDKIRKYGCPNGESES